MQFYTGVYDVTGMEIEIDTSKWGFFSFSTGKIIIPPIFEYAYPFYGDRAQVKKGGKFGLIDLYGDLVLKIEWDNINELCHSNDPMYIVQKDNKLGLSDKFGCLVLKPEWEDIVDAGNSGEETGLLIVKKNDKFGYADRNGKIEGSAVTLKEELKWGYIKPKHKGQYISQLIFEEAGYFFKFFHTEGTELLIDRRYSFVAPVELEGMWGLIDHKGKMLFHPQFELVGELFSDCLIVKRDGRWGYINNELNLILQEPNCNYLILGEKKLYIKNGRISLTRNIKLWPSDWYYSCIWDKSIIFN